MTGKRIKEPAHAPDNVTKKEIQSAVKVGKQERLYHDLELELTSLKSYVEGCHK